MPWRGPEHPGDFPTLGFDIAEWVQSYCVIPDREEAGDSFVLTPEQLLFFAHHYRINPDAERDPRTGRWLRGFVYERGSQLMRPQKWGKAPVSAAMALAEAAADVLFDGWDAQGEPVGRPWPTPHIQITACSEDQTDNVWRALLPMIRLGALVDMLPDAGLTRINLPSGGLIEPVTAAAISRLGQRVTFAVEDQTESWVQTNGGHKLADNQRRGLAGTGGRFIETPNAFDPVEDSVAQRTYESKTPGVYRDYKPPPAGSVRNKRERDEVLQVVYGDSTIEKGGWIDLGRIHAEIEALLEHDPAQAERWFMNRTLASEGAAFDFEAWKRKSKKYTVPKGAQIVIGVDGALHDDALAVVACEISTGYMWPLGIWERPADAQEGYEHPKHEVDGAVREAFDTFDVWRLYADPQWIESLLEGWQNAYGEKRVVAWMTYRPRPIGWAVRYFEQAVARKPGPPDPKQTHPALTHSGDEVLTRHIQNARRRKLTVLDDRERPMHTLAKPAQHSPLKIDGAMAGVLAWEALGDAIKAGVVWMGESPALPKPPEPKQWMPGSAPPAGVLVGVGETGPLGSMS